jgi:hypothetical protein
MKENYELMHHLSMPLKKRQLNLVRYCKACSTSLGVKKNDWFLRQLCNKCYRHGYLLKTINIDGDTQIEYVKGMW